MICFFKSGLAYFTVQCAVRVWVLIKKAKGVPLGRPCSGVPISKELVQEIYCGGEGDSEKAKGHVERLCCSGDMKDSQIDRETEKTGKRQDEERKERGKRQNGKLCLVSTFKGCMCHTADGRQAPGDGS